MENSKLIRVLRHLSAKELRELGRFLDSPYFNQRDDVRRLFQTLLPYLQQKQDLPDKPELHQQIHSNVAFRVTNFDLLMSYLYRLTTQFIQQEELKAETWNQKLRLAQGLRKRGLQAEFKQQMNQLHQAMDRQELRNAAFYKFHYDWLWEQTSVNTIEDPTHADDIVGLTQSIDRSYLSNKLQHACLLMTHRSVYQIDPMQVSLLPEILAQVENSEYLDIPCIAVYYYSFQMLQTPSEEAHFARFKQILFTSASQFSATEIRDLYLFAINYCVRQVNGGKTTFLNELLELYQQGLKDQSLLQNGILSRFTYHNVVGVGLGTENHSWTEHFIDTYKNAIEKKYRESSYSFNRARLAYSRKDYDGALLLLQKSNYRDPLLNLSAKTLLLKIYYEIEASDLLYSHLEALQKYLNRKRVIGYHKTNYQNIISYARKLLALNVFDKSEKNKLRQQMEAEAVLTERQWFLAQLEK